jgi:hypothetical protein
MQWTVVTEAVDVQAGNGENRSALVVLLTDGTARIELSRVGMIRRNSKNPDTPFADQLQIELDKAQECAATINELERYYDELRAEAEDHARVRVADIIGKQSPVPV